MPEPTNIKVVVRVRPYNRREQETNQRCIIKVMDRSSLLFDPDEEDDEFFFQGAKQQYRDISKRTNKKLSMEYDRVYDTDRTNEDLFMECTAPLVDAVLDGYNCSVFVYGATGAGKTFTMLGSEHCPGITFLTMRDLFDKIQSQQETRKFDVGVSYLEVYNEQVMNLLTKSGPLKLREDANGVVVSGLVLTPIYSAEELLRMLRLGNSNRTQHPTDANAESSRSHAIFQVHIRITDRSTGTKRSVKLSMIDLAGSERAASTKGLGMRFKEGASINKSLLALGNCINKLADGLKHIPYRDSNLTRILKDSLGGNCRTLMVANVSMSSLTYEDTYNTLKYASRAKKIRTVLRQNVLKSNLPKEFYVKKVNEVMLEQERLIERNKQLEAKLAQLERAGNEFNFDQTELKPWYSRIDAVYAQVTKLQQCVIGIRSKIQSLNYRQTLKKDFEQLRKLLTLDQRVLQEDYKLFTNYLNTLSSRTQSYTDELPQWRSKLEAACMELKRLKLEIKESKYQHILNMYLGNKDLEVQLSKQQINFNHLTAINNELVENSGNLLKSFTNGCDVLHQLYDRLEETQKLTPDIQNIYERLERKMRFMESETAVSIQDTELDALLAEQQESVEESTASQLTSSGRKRARTRRHTHTLSDSEFVLHLGIDSCEDSDSDDGISADTTQAFKKPCNLNVTQVISNNMNQHRALTATVTKSRPVIGHHRMVSDMISEQSVCGSADKEKLKQALFKSSKFSTQELKRTCAAAIQKENLKTFTNGCVRKSPRSLIAKTLAGSSATLRKPISRLVGTINTGSKETPVVKINRAASFRIKK